MNSEFPLISIVVPSYNQGEFIEDTLLSILNQDYPNLEVIVIDGGSTDQTVNVLERYSQTITFISESDNGQSDALNKGFRMAKGSFVGWLNSDDIYPDRRAVSKIFFEFSRDPSADLIYGNFIEIDSKNLVLKIYKRPKYSHKRLLRIGYISQPATFFRRRVIDSMAVREDLTYAMDLEYWLRAHKLQFKIKHTNFLIAAERLHDEAKGVKTNKEQGLEAREVRVLYGAEYNKFYSLYRFLDRLLLYAFRCFAISDLLFYKYSPKKLTIPLKFEGAVSRTLSFRLTK
tara:strand:- start:11 stop:871 length:861 start_codon:yes stop_codon:yes gene_type:complete